jgi:imidazolonepropionase-like amidohydrolase
MGSALTGAGRLGSHAVCAIRANHAFDGEDFRAGGATVLVDDAGIVGVEPLRYEPPSDCDLVDYGDATVLPGLIDTHVHLVGDSRVMALERLAEYSPEEIDAVVIESLRRQLAAGVTTVRDLGDWHFNVVERRDAQRQVDDGLPWIVASGPPITSPGGHCGYLGGEVSGADEIVAAVRERAELRVDVVKVMASGGMVTTGSDVFVPQFPIEELRLLVEQAHAAGLPVTAHAHSAAAVDQAVVAGVEGIEHASSRATEEQLAALAASGIAVCPTLGGFNTKSLAALLAVAPRFQQIFADAGLTPESYLEIRMSALRRMTTFGIQLISGDDAGIGPDKAHGTYAEAVIELGQVTGTVPALVAASSDPAAAIGLGRSKGRLRREYDADLLVVGGDLAADLTALRDVRQVVLRGVPVSPRSGQS